MSWTGRGRYLALNKIMRQRDQQARFAGGRSRRARQTRRYHPGSQAAQDMARRDQGMQEIGKAIDDLLKLKNRLIQYSNYKGVVTWLLRRIRASGSYGMSSQIPYKAVALRCNCDPDGFEPGSAQVWIHQNHTLFNLATWEIVRVERTAILAAAEAKLTELEEEDENRARLQALINYFLCPEGHAWLIGTHSGFDLV